MGQEEFSAEDTLRAVRELMKAPVANKSQKDEILELTEDDLCPDELESDLVNGKLTKLSNDLKSQTGLSDKNSEFTKAKTEPAENEIIKITSDEEILISAENAAKSIKTIKDLIQRAQNPGSNIPVIKKDVTVEEVADKAIKPLLKDWLNEYLPSMVEEVVEREIKRIVPKQE